MLNITAGRVYFTLSGDQLCVFSELCCMIMLHLCLTGIPDCSEEDLSVARALNLRWTTVLKSDEDGTQTLMNSGEVSTVYDYHTIDNMQLIMIIKPAHIIFYLVLLFCLSVVLRPHQRAGI